jgi:hypothetical protein
VMTTLPRKWMDRFAACKSWWDAIVYIHCLRHCEC